tara:strand:+ start:367 stop:537 length:171 start_codon:yes stop_codon:yes gene_type:complete
MKKNNSKNDKKEDFRQSIVSNTTKKEIKKSYDIEIGQGTEAYFSDRYGWTLRKAIK